ncbi:MAG: hypothetical protein N2V77_01205 [Canidatus Methanoxibalbensis ujae]|nr:hypothetical protein [Candidatus Methanoxibalbensis ujae]
MKKILAIGIGIIALSLLACSIGLVTADEGSEEYTVIDAPLSPMEGEYIYSIPPGSVIYHSADGITTVYAPDGKPILKARDSDAAKIPTPSGMIPATRVHVYPSGSYGIREQIEFYTEDRGKITGNTTKYYAPDGTLLITIKSEKSATGEGEKTGGIMGEHTGWIECARDIGQDLDLFEFTAYWDCPCVPSSPEWNTADLLFNAIQEYSGGTVIMHPILLWYTPNGDWIAYAQWGPDAEGDYHSSEPINVDVGDKLRGKLTYQVLQTRWYIEIKNIDTGDVTYIYTWPLVAGAVNLDIFTTLEGYHVHDVTDVPGEATFYDMSFSYQGNPVDVEWLPWVNQSVKPDIPGLQVFVCSDSEVKLLACECGDVDCKNGVTSADATKVRWRVSHPSYQLTNLWAADVDCKNGVTSADATKVRWRVSHPSYQLTCCKCDCPS